MVPADVLPRESMPGEIYISTPRGTQGFDFARQASHGSSASSSE